MHVRFTGSRFELCPVNGKLPRVLSRLHQTAVSISADDFIQGSTVAGVLECFFTVPSAVVMLINNKNDMHLDRCCAMQQLDSTIPITRLSNSLKCKHKQVLLNGLPVFSDCIENKWKLYSWIFSLIIYECVKSLSPLMKKGANMLEHSLAEHATKPNKYLMQTEMCGKRKWRLHQNSNHLHQGLQPFSAKHLWPESEAANP